MRGQFSFLAGEFFWCFDAAQCDQMAKLFLKIRPLTLMKICAKALRNGLSKFNNSPNVK